jgi:hypothetical protein
MLITGSCMSVIVPPAAITASSTATTSTVVEVVMPMRAPGIDLTVRVSPNSSVYVTSTVSTAGAGVPSVVVPARVAPLIEVELGVHPAIHARKSPRTREVFRAMRAESSPGVRRTTEGYHRWSPPPQRRRGDRGHAQS